MTKQCKVTLFFLSYHVISYIVKYIIMYLHIGWWKWTNNDNHVSSSNAMEGRLSQMVWWAADEESGKYTSKTGGHLGAWHHSGKHCHWKLAHGVSINVYILVFGNDLKECPLFCTFAYVCLLTRHRWQLFFILRGHVMTGASMTTTQLFWLQLNGNVMSSSLRN